MAVPLSLEICLVTSTGSEASVPDKSFRFCWRIISFSTTSGTAGCENWDLVKTNRVEYMDVTWNNLSEDVSKGKGEHFSALSKLYGCEDKYIQTFESMLYGNYTHLFEEISDIEKYERAHLLDYEINRLMKNYRIKEFCKFSS